MKLLGNICSPDLEIEVELLHVKLWEPDGNILRAQITRVLGSRNLLDREQPAGLLLLQPENVDFNVSYFVEARSLRHANGGTGIHADANSSIGDPEIAEESRHAEPFR